MEIDLISRKALLKDVKPIIQTLVRIKEKTPINDESGRHRIRQALRLLEEAPTIEAEPKWISVEEKLPENELSVIAYSKEDGHAWYAFRRGGSWWRHGDRISIKVYGTVTHWMPLPEMPKEE